MNKQVGKNIPKKDGVALAVGRAVYTNDMAPNDALIVKFLRSPYAFAKIKKIDKSKAEKLQGVATIITHLDKDVSRVAYTRAGQGYPEPSPYDKFILDEYVRHVGDEVLAVAALTEDIAQRALELIEVEYEELEPVLDFEKAIDNSSIIHPEKEAYTLFPIGFEKNRNIAAAYGCEVGNTKEEIEKSDCIVEGRYFTQAQAHVTTECHNCYTYLDTYGRLNVVSSTQVPMHVRRIMSKALKLDRSNIRVYKPRVGGGYGGKQQIHGEMVTAITTLRTGKPAVCLYDRKEVFESTCCRHQMRIDVKIGAKKDGTINAIDMWVLSDTGAYGEHALTVFMLAGGKTLPMYVIKGKTKAVKFGGQVCYTNKATAGAYRGYGAMQGNFALESTMDKLAEKLGMDPISIREKNIIHEGETSPLFEIMGEGTEGSPMTIESCKLDYCIKRVRKISNWDSKFKKGKIVDGKIKSVGMAIAMQGSGIADIDMASAILKLNDDGFFNLLIGATEIGQGSDTVMAQIAADVLGMDSDKFAVYSADTDTTPFDPGAYASKTTFVTGNAVIKTAKAMKKLIISEGAKYLGVKENQVSFNGKEIKTLDGKRSVDLATFASDRFYAMGGDQKQLLASESYVPDVSPPPYMAAVAEIELDVNTGDIKVLDYYGVIDCGGIINPNLCKVQAEGGLVQGIGMAVYEDVQYSKKGEMLTNSFMNYKIPARKDVTKLTVEFADSYDPAGPFGAKSIGEIGIDTPMAAIANAIYTAVGVRIIDLPITPEKVLLALQKKKK